MNDPKGFAFDTVEHNREAIALLCDNIFYGSSRKSVGDFGGYAWLQAAPV